MADQMLLRFEDGRFEYRTIGVISRYWKALQKVHMLLSIGHFSRNQAADLMYHRGLALSTCNHRISNVPVITLTCEKNHS
jgi:hypothetical protein